MPAGRGAATKPPAVQRSNPAGRGGPSGRGATCGSGAAADNTASSSISNGGASGPLIPASDPVGELMSRLAGLKELSMNGEAVDETLYEIESDDDEQGMIDGIQDFERRLAGVASQQSADAPMLGPGAPSASTVVAPPSRLATQATAAKATLASRNTSVTSHKPMLQQLRPQPQPQRQPHPQSHNIQPRLQETQATQAQMRGALAAVQQQAQVKPLMTSTKPSAKLPSSKARIADNDETADRDDVRAAMRDLDRFDRDSDSD